jgi:hypothetical protein
MSTGLADFPEKWLGLRQRARKVDSLVGALIREWRVKRLAESSERETMNRAGKLGFGLRKSETETSKRELIYRFALRGSKRSENPPFRA